MDRNKFSMYWSYYKMIEEKLISTNQYVTHTNDNGKCYSDEFTSIILLSCSEIDSILKELLINLNISPKKIYYQMSDYANVLIKFKDKGIETVSTRIDVHDNNNFNVTPFKNINANLPYANLNWWKDYQAIKHDRIHNVKKGNLANAITVLSAHFLIVRLLIHFIPEENGQSYLFEKTWSEYWIPAV
ncbi:hypothetical protein ACFDBE_00445 [Staphylococcus epidermidis]